MKFTTNGDLKRHQRRKDTFKKLNKCTSCDMNFTTRNQLNHHKQYKHTHQQAIVFTNFDSKCLEEGTLLRYQRRIPILKKLFKCYFCFKQYVSINVIKLHKRNHTGV